MIQINACNYMHLDLHASDLKDISPIFFFPDRQSGNLYQEIATYSTLCCWSCSLLLYGVVCTMQDKHEPAETFFETATSVEPRSMLAWTMLGTVTISKV